MIKVQLLDNAHLLIRMVAPVASSATTSRAAATAPADNAGVPAPTTPGNTTGSNVPSPTGVAAIAVERVTIAQSRDRKIGVFGFRPVVVFGMRAVALVLFCAMAAVVAEPTHNLSEECTLC